MENLKIGDSVLINFTSLNVSQTFSIYKFLPDKNQIYISHIDDPDYKTVLSKKDNVWKLLNYDSPHTVNPKFIFSSNFKSEIYFRFWFRFEI